MSLSDFQASNISNEGFLEDCKCQPGKSVHPSFTSVLSLSIAPVLEDKSM